MLKAKWGSQDIGFPTVLSSFPIPSLRFPIYDILSDHSMIHQELAACSIEHLREGVERIGQCLGQLTPEQIWSDHNAHLVSVGNLILHLQGNVSQYIINGLGGEAYQRHRDEEFTTKPALSAEELLSRITNTVDKACILIARLSEEELMRTYAIQGFRKTGVAALVHVVEHFSYHVGQITFAVKFLRDIDMGYYAGMNLNAQ